MSGWFPFAFVFSSLSILLVAAVLDYVGGALHPALLLPGTARQEEAPQQRCVGMELVTLEVFWQRSFSCPPYSSVLSCTRGGWVSTWQRLAVFLLGACGLYSGHGEEACAACGSWLRVLCLPRLSPIVPKYDLTKVVSCWYSTGSYSMINLQNMVLLPKAPFSSSLIKRKEPGDFCKSSLTQTIKIILEVY